MTLASAFAPTSLLGAIMLGLGVGVEVKNAFHEPKAEIPAVVSEVTPVLKPETLVVEAAPQPKVEPVPTPAIVILPTPPPKPVVKEKPAIVPEVPKAEVPKAEVPKAEVQPKTTSPDPFEIPEDMFKEFFPDLKNPMGKESVKPTLEIIVSIQRRLSELTKKAIPLREGVASVESKVEGLQKDYQDEVNGVRGKAGVGPNARAIEAKIAAQRKILSSKRKELFSVEQERDGLIELLGNLTKKLGIPVIGAVSERDLEALLGTIEVVAVSKELASQLNQSLITIVQGVAEVPMEDLDERRPRAGRAVTIPLGAKIPVAVVEAIGSTADARETMARSQLRKVSPNTVKINGRVALFPRPKSANGYDKPFPVSEKVGPLAGGEFFGGIRAKTYYRNVTGSVFSHMGKAQDSGDNGRSFWRFLTGARMGKNGQVIHHAEGVALPPQIYELVGPASEVDIWIKNIDNNCGVVCPVVDAGPSNWVWKLVGGPVIDMTPRTAVALGATIFTKGNNIRGVGGVRNNLEVEVVRRGEKPRHIRF